MRSRPERDATIAAYHEAGHVLVAHLLGGEVVETTLESERDDHVGHTAVAWRDRDDAELAGCSARVALAGPVAEILWRGEEVLHDQLRAWRADWNELDAALGRLAAPAERAALRRRMLAEIAAQLGEPEVWERLCRIADALEAHGTLDASLLEELLG